MQILREDGTTFEVDLMDINQEHCRQTIIEMIRTNFPEKGFKLTELDFEFIISKFEKDSGKTYDADFFGSRK